MTPDPAVERLLESACDLLVSEPVSCTCVGTNCGASKGERIREIAASLQRSNVPPGTATELEGLITLATDTFKTFPHKSVPVCWRSVHTDASILRSVCDLLNDSLDTSAWEEAVARLDKAIVISGAAGFDRLDLLYHFIETVQALHLPLLHDPFVDDPDPLPPTSAVRLPLHSHEVPRLSSPPSLGAFTKTFSSVPFILPNFCSDWPALNEHTWRSRSYLLRAAGRARVVPVELGADYTKDDWSQELMRWEDFLASTSDPNSGVRYLAQHDLLTQFPALRNDIVVPDYVYAAVPGARDTLLLNAWVGRRGAGSPAHVDEFSNCYCMVSGRRTVWLAPPSVAPGMDPDRNTARVDVFGAEHSHSEEYLRNVVPHALAALLESGDMLYIPRGWWHAFRIEETSFAVSMWF